MTIKQLKAIIKDLPDTMDVFMGDRVSEFGYGLVNSAIIKEIEFYDQYGDEEPLAVNKVLVLEED